MHKLGDYQIQSIIDLHNKGVGAREIIERLGLGVSERQVYRIIKPYRAEQCAKARLEELDWIGGHLDELVKWRDSSGDRLNSWIAIGTIDEFLAKRRTELQRGQK